MRPRTIAQPERKRLPDRQGVLPKTVQNLALVWTEAEDMAGHRLAVVTYKVPNAAPEGKPGRRYLELIREAARQRALPAAYIAFLERVEAHE